MIKFSDATINYLESKVKEDYEVCVRFRENENNELDIQSRVKGNIKQLSNGTTRNFCEWGNTPLTRVILHTHPKKSKHYPSREDYSKVYKHKYVDIVQHSLIYSPVGIFQLTNMKYGQDYKNTQKEENDLIHLIKLVDIDFYEAHKDWLKNQDLDLLNNRYAQISNKINQTQNRINLSFFPF